MRFIWLLIILPAWAFADGDTTTSYPVLFHPSTNDLSINYLKMIFGQVGSVLLGPPNQLIQEVFTVFNLGIMTLAGLLMCYTVILSVVNTSQEGNPMGHKMSPWVVVRIVTGCALMMPMSTGYAVIQVLTMWMVVQGIGFADEIWTKAVGVIAQSSTGVYPAATIDDNPYEDIYNSGLLKNYTSQNNSPNQTNPPIIASLFASNLCLEATYQSDLINNKDSNTVSRSDYYIKMGTDSTADSTNCNKTNNFCFVTPGDATGAPGSVCGVYIAPQYRSKNPIDDPQAQQVALTAAYNTAISLQGYVQNIFSQDLNTLQNSDDINTSLQDMAKQAACVNGNFNSNPTEDQYYNSCAQVPYLDGLAESYLAYLGSYAYSTGSDSGSSDDDVANWATEAIDYGWLSAGAYYTSLSGSNTGTISTTVKSQIDTLTYYKQIAPVFDYSTPDNQYTHNNAKYIYNIYDTYTFDSSTNSFTGKDGASSSTASNQVNQFNFINNYYMTYANIQMNNIADSQGTSTNNSGDSCSFSDENNMLGTLNSATYLLAKYWLQYKATENSSGVFDDLNLYTLSMLDGGITSDTDGDSNNVAVVYISAPQRGFYVLMNRALSELMGVKYFKNFAYNAPSHFGSDRGDQQGNPKGGHAGWSGVLNNKDNAFEQACNDGLIDTNGHGLFGEVLASMQGKGYDPLAQMRFMGLNIMRYGIDYFSTVIGEMIDDYTQLALNYWGMGVAFAVVATVPVAATIASFAAVPYPSAIPAAVAQMMQMLTSIFQQGMQILYQVDQITMSLWSPISASSAVIYSVLGFTMGVYLANLPAIVFVFAAVGFFMYVIEAMIASALVALGLTHPEGHDLLGKAEQSVMLLLAAFIRPAAIIIGLIFSMTLMIPAFRLLNFTFIGLISGYFDFFDDSGSIVPLIGAVGIAFLYVYMSMTVINNCISLIYQIPDRLLRWLGAPTEPSMIQQMVNEVKGAVTDAAKQTAGGGESAAGGAKVSTSSLGPQSASWSAPDVWEDGKQGPSVSDGGSGSSGDGPTGGNND